MSAAELAAQVIEVERLDAALRRVRAECQALEVDAAAETGKAVRLRHQADVADMAGDPATAAAHRHDADVHYGRAQAFHDCRRRVLHAIADTAQHADVPAPRGRS